ncbi:MAG: cytochrome c [Deltaproteobacteria bacterium]|jgi:mono/diheme cytochrome c family protein|nr:cytochrome c [Deltaproteobacteria bacterium]
MEYPIWFIPGLSKGMIMAAISVIHVFVSQFAVGGGIYLVWMERRVLKNQERLMEGRAQALTGSSEQAVLLDWLRGHTKFFLLLTMVFGALTGVAIWFTMSVINPAATSALLHIFLWIWAAEWVFFLLEVAALLLYHYSYPMAYGLSGQECAGRISPRTHLWIGYIYAISGYMSLVLINGVICFMLTPGDSLASGSLFAAFFNPTFFPSMVFRTGLCLLLAGLFALFSMSSAVRVQDTQARRALARHNSLWVIVPFLVLLAGAIWYFFALPPDRQAAMLRGSADIHPFARSFACILPIIFLLGLLAYVRAEKLRLPLAALILCSGLVLVGSFEWLREAGRRPWVIPDYMYSNTVRPEADGTARIVREQGLAAVSGWIKGVPPAALDRRSQDGGRADGGLSRGELIFAQQCGLCHAVGGSRLDILPRVQRFAQAGLEAQIRGQGAAPLDYMPPFYGSGQDLKELAAYLNLLRDAEK